MNEEKQKEFQNRTLNILEQRILHYENLLKYTKKSVKQKHIKDNIKFLKDVIEIAKSEYEI